MRTSTATKLLRSTVAVGALVLAATAHAACNPANGVVTCTGPSTTNDANNAIARAAIPSVTVVVAPGATVQGTFNSQIIVDNSRFRGAIGYTSDGIVGAADRPNDFVVFGQRSDPANTFNLINRGTQEGGISALGMGGAIIGVNTGLVTRGITLDSAGPITFTNTGTVYRSNDLGGLGAIRLESSRLVGTFAPDGTLTLTELGGAVTATIGGHIGSPVGGGTPVRPGGVSVRGVGGADVTVTGRAGVIDISAGGNTSERRFSFVSSAQGSTNSDAETRRTSLADARINLSETGAVTSVFLSGSGNATAIINGVVQNGFNTVRVFSGGTSSTSSTRTSSNTASASSLSSTSSNTSDRRDALVDIGTTGLVLGDVFVGGGLATVRVAGTVGDTLSRATISATATANNGSAQYNFARRADGSSDSNNTSTQTLAGGAALVTVATTGNVLGNVSADGDASAIVDNAGRIGGEIVANSGRLLSTSSASSQRQTITNGVGGVQTFAIQSISDQVTETLGGTARVFNAPTALVRGSVQVSGVGGATLEIAGTVRSSIDLTSAGARTASTSSERTTQLTTLRPNGSLITTSLVQDTAGTSSQRATGGAVNGTYSGTVGVAPLPKVGSFASINQDGTTASNATITGTVFGGLDGTAGGTNSDSASNSTSAVTTLANGTSTRSISNSFNSTATQVASTSTLTVGATGALLDNSRGPANVNIVSRGGGAGFTLDGGSVTGNVMVNAGAQSDATQASTSSSTFTRTAPTLPFYVFNETQQTQVSANQSVSTAARGTGTATISAGTIGGDLRVTGVGTGSGTTAASVLVGGTVMGNVTAQAFGTDLRNTSSEDRRLTAPGSITATITSSAFVAPIATLGNTVVTINGSVGGGVSAFGSGGSATVNVAGGVGTVMPNGVNVNATDSMVQWTQSATGVSPFFFQYAETTAQRSTSSSTAVGGTATLNVTPRAGPASTLSSIEGNLVVQGSSGSTMNLAAGARLVQTTGFVHVGVTLGNTTSETNGVFANGFQTGTTGTSTSTPVGGMALLTNAGTIGSTANQTNVSVSSVGGATARNSGTIDGSVQTFAAAIRRSATKTTDIDSFMLRQSVTSSTSTPVLGATLVDNSGLVTGGIVTLAGNGVVANSGVVRGLVTLGGSLGNFVTTTTTTPDPNTGATITTSAPSVVNAVLATQNYQLDQTGLLVGGVNVTGTTVTDPSGATVRTSNVNAAVNLNNGSITLGNITAEANTVANVNLNGSGFLGVAANNISTNMIPGQIVTGFVPTPSLTRFSAIDPALGVTVLLVSGSRISGVQTVTKAGDGTFVIVGAPIITATGTTPLVNTLDVATLRVSDGELQLGLSGTSPTANTFGIRGNVDNAASLVIGRRITDGTQAAVYGINIAVSGNLTNAATGGLVVGVNPAFTHSNAASPFAPFGQTPGIASTPSFVRVDGDLTLAGSVNIVAPTGGIYEAGRAYDLFSVGGAYANTGTVRSNIVSPFIGFTLTPRSEGGRTIVSLNVARANFDTVATDRNSAAAAQALQTAISGIAAGLRAGSTGSQDLAGIVAALDTQFTAAQSAEAFRQLSSGEFYGSLAAISTTVPFGEATDGLSPNESEPRIGLWFRPTGQFAMYKANEVAGASAINLDNHGGSVGLNFSTGNGGHAGIAGGYSALKVRAFGTPERAEAKTYMVGFYASQQLGNLNVSGQAVFGRSDWDASRGLPLFARTATSSFKSAEVRASLRVAYSIDVNKRFQVTPFVRGEARYFRFDGFEETGAGSIGLAVGRRAKTVLNPEVGVRISGSSNDGNLFRPFAEGSYVFQGIPGTDRRMAIVGNNSGVFIVDGARPGDAIKAAIGVSADVGPTSVFVRGEYASGGMQQVGSVRGGVLLKF